MKQHDVNSYTGLLLLHVCATFCHIADNLAIISFFGKIIEI